MTSLSNHFFRTVALIFAACSLALCFSPISFADAAPPSDVYVYSLMAWNENDKQDPAISRYMSAHKDSPMWAIEFLNNSTDILPNTTIHYVVEDHGSDPITAIRMFNAFLESVAYPVVLVLVEAVEDPEVTSTVARLGNAFNIPIATVMSSGSEYTDQSLYSNVLRCVSIIYSLLVSIIPHFISTLSLQVSFH